MQTPPTLPRSQLPPRPRPRPSSSLTPSQTQPWRSLPTWPALRGRCPRMICPSARSSRPRGSRWLQRCRPPPSLRPIRSPAAQKRRTQRRTARNPRRPFRCVCVCVRMRASLARQSLHFVSAARWFALIQVYFFEVLWLFPSQSMTLKDLKALLKERSLPVTGKKVGRLCFNLVIVSSY